MTTAVEHSDAQPERRGRNAETRIMKDVADAARALGIMVWRTNPIAPPLNVNGRLVYRSNAAGASGIADLCGVCPGGRFIAIEVKSSAAAPLRARQALYLDDVTRLGGIAVVCSSAAQLLTQVGGERPANWYGVVSPFALTASVRAKWQAKALREEAAKAHRRRMARAG